MFFTPVPSRELNNKKGVGAVLPYLISQASRIAYSVDKTTATHTNKI